MARLAGIPNEVIVRSKKILSNIEKGEHHINGSPVIAGENAILPKDGHKQLTLFGKQEYALIEKLQKLEIAKMTPLDALNYLNHLLEKVKTFTV